MDLFEPIKKSFDYVKKHYFFEEIDLSAVENMEMSFHCFITNWGFIYNKIQNSSIAIPDPRVTTPNVVFGVES